jgi:phosphomannomutase
VKRVSIAVREQEAHLGILIDDDAQRCVLFDDCGARAAPDRLLPLFAEHERETRRAALVVSEAIGEPGSANPTVRNPGDATRIADGATLSAMSLALKEPGAMCGGGASGRYWFVESFPTCDAVLTLVKLLQILSRSDRPFSEVLSRKSAAS